MTGWEVLDSAVKIGLGALISATAGYFMLNKTQSHDREKERQRVLYEFREERKLACSTFLSAVDTVAFKLIDKESVLETSETDLLFDAYSKVAIISEKKVEELAHQIIVALARISDFNKGEEGLDLDALLNESSGNRRKFIEAAQDSYLKSYSDIFE